MCVCVCVCKGVCVCVSVCCVHVLVSSYYHSLSYCFVGMAYHS